MDNNKESDNLIEYMKNRVLKPSNNPDLQGYTEYLKAIHTDKAEADEKLLRKFNKVKKWLIANEVEDAEITEEKDEKDHSKQ